MKSLLGGSAIVAVALLSGSLIFSPRQSFGETLLTQFQQQKQEPTQTQKPGPVADSSAAAEVAVNPTTSSPTTSAAKVTESSEANAPPKEAMDLSAIPAAPPARYLATAYSLRGRTASGKPVAKGMIAADPRVLPMGSRIRLEAGPYSGEYLVADTGGAVRGKRIDIWTSSTREARRFGRRSVKLSVLSYGPKRIRVRRNTHN
jgi:3D (Asp-Asp-Asp) domain-containing protein